MEDASAHNMHMSVYANWFIFFRFLARYTH